MILDQAPDVAVRVTEASDADAQAWDAFLAAQPGATFYQLFGWRTIVRDQLGLEPVYLMARADGQVVGVLPLVFLASRIFGRILCSMPFLNYGGPCAVSERVTRQLVEAAIVRAGQLSADYLELRCPATLPMDLPVSTGKISMTIELQPDPEQLWNGFKSKHRTNVRRAAREGLTVDSGGAELLDPFFRVLERSWRDLGTPLYRRDFFAAILDAFPQQARIFVCRHGTEPVAVAFNGSHAGVVEGMWAGGLPAARQLNANYVLYWEMIRDGCLRGQRRFHLGRSTADSGGEWFKSRWNAEASQLYWYYHQPHGGPLPALNVQNPKYRLAIAAWRRLPLWLVRRIGPKIARSIP